MDAGDLLKTMLPMAVTMRILDFKQLPWEQIQAIATEASQFIGEHGDNILFIGPKKGDTAKAFNELTKGLAALSFVPGGVKLFGLHFEATHPDSLTSSSGRWLYDIALADALPMIAKDGLVPEDHEHVYFTGTLGEAARYAASIFSEKLTKLRSSWDPVLMRVHSAHLQDADPYGLDDWAVERKVPAIFIQVWVPQNEAWVEVREAEEQGYFSEFRTKYGEPGKLDVEPNASAAEYAARYIEQFWPKS